MKDFLFLGDSITDCGHSFDPENLGNGYVRIIANYFKSQCQGKNIQNMGVDGFTVTALKRLWNQCCHDIRPNSFDGTFYLPMTFGIFCIGSRRRTIQYCN